MYSLESEKRENILVFVWVNSSIQLRLYINSNWLDSIDLVLDLLHYTNM